MDIHRYLYGTKADGAYGDITASPELYRFLTKEVGATSERTVLEKISSLFKPHTALEGYNRYRIADFPVSTRYAPMHLGMLPDMPADVRPFCALGFSGYEYRDFSMEALEVNQLGRNTFYTMIQMFSCDRMNTSGKYNYLDYLFGSKPFSFKDAAAVRNGEKNFEEDVYLEKVAPTMRQEDKVYVLAAVEDIYAGKDILIRLEPKAFYNHRAKEILTQIYSMLQPRLAVEVGYSSYQNPAGIDAIRNAWSVRIFVVPGEESLEKVNLDHFTVLDLAEPLKREATPMQQTLNAWWSIPWDKRIAMLEMLFKDTTTNFNNAVHFMEQSNYVFNGIKELNAWRKQPPISKLTSLAAVKDELNSHEVWKYIPWAVDTISLVLRKHKVPLKEYTAQACLQSYEATDSAARRYYRGLYEIGKVLEKQDSETAVEIIREGMEVAKNGKWIQKIQELEAACEEKLSVQQAAFEAERNALQSTCEEKLAAQLAEFEVTQHQLLSDLQTQLSNQKNAAEKELATQKKAYEQQLSAKISDLNSQMEAQKRELTAQRKRSDDSYKEKLADQQLDYERRLNIQKTKYESKVSMLEKKAAELDSALKIRTDACKKLTVEIEMLRSRVRELESKNEDKSAELEEWTNYENQVKEQEKRKKLVKKTLLAVLGGGLAVGAIVGKRNKRTPK